MKRALLVVAMLAGALLCGCAALSSPASPTTHVSADYQALGNAGGVRAFVYGKRTVLEFSSRPLWLAIRDENGVAVTYEREGHYYRLSRKLDHFTVWANTRVLSFSPTRGDVQTLTAEASVQADVRLPADQTKDAISPVAPPVAVSAQAAPTDDATALLRLSMAQSDEVRHAILEAGSDRETKTLLAHLDRVEARLLSAAAVVIRLQFDAAATELAVDERFVRTVIPAARAAERIILRGRTDARIAGSKDARIALGRALAARQFLIDHGVDSAKITLFSLAAGDFLAPAGSEKGRRLNRRVDIELVDRRYAERQQHVVRLDGTTP